VSCNDAVNEVAIVLDLAVEFRVALYSLSKLFAPTLFLLNELRNLLNRPFHARRPSPVSHREKQTAIDQASPDTAR